MAVTIAGSGTVTGVDPDSFETGLRHVVTKDFSATSVSVDNCFTSEFDNYRVIVYSNSSGTSPTITWRNRASGTDESTANYTFQRSIIRTSVSATQTVNATAMDLPDSHNGVKAAVVIEVLGPNRSEPTVYLCHGFNSYLSGTNFLYAGGLNTTTSADGFTLASAQTLTGTLRVYGYMNGVAS